MKPDDPLDTAKGVAVGFISSVVILIILGLAAKIISLIFMFGWGLI